MIKLEKIDFWGFEHAVRGMRNPMNSWEKSDSYFLSEEGDAYNIIGDTMPWPDEGYVDDLVLGDSDISLMKRLYVAGPEHRKYLRQIFVSMDITAPLYWWKEFDTYKVGTVANSCSTMHKIAAKEFELADFSFEHILSSPDEFGFAADLIRNTIWCLNKARKKYLETKDKRYWWTMIQLLPTSYKQKRTVTMNYENVVTIIKQRSGHKLDEWNEFVALLMTLPYIREIIEDEKRGESR